MVGHVSPEAARGGPLAALQDGDTVVIDVEARELRVELSDDELAARLADWAPPPPRYSDGRLREVRRARVLGVGGSRSRGRPHSASRKSPIRSRARARFSREFA